MARAVRSQAIKLIGVDDRFVETGHVIVDGDDVPEVVMLNGDAFIAVTNDRSADDSREPRQYRKVRPFRFVRKALP